MKCAYGEIELGPWRVIPSGDRAGWETCGMTLEQAGKETIIGSADLRPEERKRSDVEALRAAKLELAVHAFEEYAEDHGWEKVE